MTARDAVQVSGAPNAAQLKNTSIANSLFSFHTLVTQVLDTPSEVWFVHIHTYLYTKFVINDD